MSEIKKNKILGIDLGTTNCCMAISEGGKVKIIDNSEGSRITPSVVSWVENLFMVGNPAKRQGHSNPKNTIYEVKRLMGRKFDEISQSTLKSLPYKVVRLENGDAGVEIEGQTYTPSYISAMILQKLASMASSYLGYEIKRAVITVPAYFNDAQRQATKEAGRIAGLEVERIINEPTAAAMAYGFDTNKGGTIVVFDLGGGTFDVSVLEITGKDFYEVKSTGGDTLLGGADFDAIILEWIVKKFKQDHGIDLTQDKAMYRIREAAENAKKELSSSLETRIQIPFITGSTHIDYTISRSTFESMTSHLVQKAINICEEVLKAGSISIHEVDHIVLVGGMTRMPLVVKTVEKFFGKAPSGGINPDEAVAVGAAIQGGIIEGDISDIVLLDVTSLSFGIETMGGQFTKIIERNTTIPASETKTFTTAEDNQTSVTISIYQGERPRAVDNKHLGSFVLEGIPPAPRGSAKIAVTFDIDGDGTITITAADKDGGRKRSIKILPSSGATKEEVEQMKAAAEKLREEDARVLAMIEKRNSLDHRIYEIGKKVSKLEADKASEAKEMREKIDSLRAKKDEASDIAQLNQIEKDLASLEGEIDKIGPKNSKNEGTEETVNPS